jgi:hypothetical protein
MGAKIRVITEFIFFHLLNRIRYFLPTPSGFTQCYVTQRNLQNTDCFYWGGFKISDIGNNGRDIFKEIDDCLRGKMERGLDNAAGTAHS